MRGQQAIGVFHQEAVMAIATQQLAQAVQRNSRGTAMTKQLVQAPGEAGANQLEG